MGQALRVYAIYAENNYAIRIGTTWCSYEKIMSIGFSAYNYNNITYTRLRWQTNLKNLEISSVQFLFNLYTARLQLLISYLSPFRRRSCKIVRSTYRPLSHISILQISVFATRTRLRLHNTSISTLSVESSPIWIYIYMFV